METIVVAPQLAEPKPRDPVVSARARLGGLERPLLAGGLLLVTAHLLDLAISGPDTALLALLAIVAIPAVWLVVQPRLIRPTRFGLALAVGALALGFGLASHGLHVVNSGPDWRDVTGVGMAAGGLALIGSAVCAAAAPARAFAASRRRSAANVAGWLAGAAVLVVFAVIPLASGLLVTHAPRWAIQESSLGIAHDEVRVPMAGGRALSGWWVPSRNGAAVLLMHGSGGSRGRVTAHVRMLARHGYGVLALDLPGNGESDGHSNGLGDNAQPAVRAGVDWLSRRADRVAGYGLSLGAEVLIEAAARDDRLRAVVADGATRPEDAEAVADPSVVDRLASRLGLLAARGISGMRAAPSLNGLIGRIAPRPVLLVASGGFPDEIPANRVYRARGGATTSLWELPDAGHTGGLRARPAEYERRTTAFLDRALGL